MSEITDASMTILTPRNRGGRPRVTDGPSSVVSVRIFSGHHDALVKMAEDRGIPVADLLRRILGTVATRYSR